MTKKSELGRVGEDRACGYLVENGYRIIERNYRKKWGELDIVAKDPNQVLVFIEVKTMRQYIRQAQYKSGNQYNSTQDSLSPEDQMTSAKMKKFKRVAEEYARGHEKLIGEKGWQCDLLALTYSGKDFIIAHYKIV